MSPSSGLFGVKSMHSPKQFCKLQTKSCGRWTRVWWWSFSHAIHWTSRKRSYCIVSPWGTYLLGQLLYTFSDVSSLKNLFCVHFSIQLLFAELGGRGFSKKDHERTNPWKRCGKTWEKCCAFRPCQRGNGLMDLSRYDRPDPNFPVNNMIIAECETVP